MDLMGVDKAILSLPPNSSGFVGPENREIARNYNAMAAKICQEHPGRFGFFATLPFLDDIEGCLTF